MSVQFRQSSAFMEIRERIEQHLYDSVLKIKQSPDLALRSVQSFADSLDQLMEMLEQMYQRPQAEDRLGEKSFPIHGGRFRVFYQVLVRDQQNFEIIFLDIDDNKQSNLDRFPSHQIKTFQEES